MFLLNWNHKCFVICHFLLIWIQMLLNSIENDALKQEKVLWFNMNILKGFKERLPTPRPTSHIFFAHTPHHTPHHTNFFHTSHTTPHTTAVKFCGEIPTPHVMWGECGVMWGILWCGAYHYPWFLVCQFSTKNIIGQKLRNVSNIQTIFRLCQPTPSITFCPLLCLGV